MRLIAVALIFGSCLWAQAQAPAPVAPNRIPTQNPGLTPRADAPTPENALTLPAGTKVPLVLKHAISTKSARENDPVYAETNFPVVLDGKIAVPVGTYVQGVITRVQRAGRVKGRAEILVHFTSLIFPNGYTVMLPGAVEGAPGLDTAKVKDPEGTMQGEGGKGKDTGTVVSSAGTGAVIGGLASRSGKGAAIGGVAGAGVGLATVLLTRGPDVRIESGSTIEMVLERPVTLDRPRAMAKN